MRVNDFIHTFDIANAPDRVTEMATLNCLDLIGVGLAGRKTRLSEIICNHAAADFGGAIPMLFDGRPASPLGVALAGGMTIDAVDAHDGYNEAKGHAGCGVFPAAYALARAEGLKSGFLDQIVLGYELGCRLAVAQHASAPDYHTSGSWIAVAIAGFASRVMGLTPHQTEHAMGIAEFHGPRSQMMRCIDFPTMVKDGSGWGAMAGVSAARLASQGFTGAPALTTQTGPWDDLGETWLTCKQYYKPYPVCRWAQGPVQAILELVKEHGLVSKDVVGIHINTFHEAVRLGLKDVQTTEDAQYSTSFPCAVALVHGNILPHHIEGAALQNAEVRRLSETLTMAEDDHANSVFPAVRLAQVELTLANGQKVESRWLEPVWSHDSQPDASQLIEKFMIYAEPVIGENRAKEIKTLALDLPNGSQNALFKCLSQPIN